MATVQTQAGCRRRRCSVCVGFYVSTLALLILFLAPKTSSGFGKIPFRNNHISNHISCNSRPFSKGSQSFVRWNLFSETNPSKVTEETSTAFVVPERKGPFSQDELVAMTKEYLAHPSPDWWAEDFVFRGPVIGPLCKKDLINTLSANIELKKAFPDLQVNAYGFSADDPIEPNRVWWMQRPRGTFAGPFEHPTKGIIEPTNTPYIAPPEVLSVIFDNTGKIRYQSVGYVADRFTGDTTGGRGAVFGQYAVMGELLDPNPGSFVLRALQKLSEFLPDVPQSYSKPEDVPKWWKDPRRGAEL